MTWASAREINVIIRSSCHEPSDAELLFSGEPWVFSDAKTIPELLVELGIYKTRSDCRRAGRDGPIKPGWTMMKASKAVFCLCIWNPSRHTTEYDGTGSRLLPASATPPS